MVDGLSMWQWVLALALCSACDTRGGEPSAEDGDGDGGTELPSPYADDTGVDDSAVPSMGKQEAAVAAAAGLRSLVSLAPSGVVTQFESLAAEFEEGCPEELEDEDEDGYRSLYFYSEGCTTSSGLFVQGAGQLERWTGLEDGGRTAHGATLGAEDGTFRLEKGTRWLQFSGYLYYDVGTYGGGEEDGDVYFGAEAAADPKTAEASPLLDGSVRVQGELYAYVEDDYKWFGGSGSLSGPGLGHALAMSFADLSVAPQECGAEPAGTVAVRDDAGFWHDIAFDAATIADNEDDEPKWHAEACDGCGTYLAAGSEDGTACVAKADIEAIVAWKVVPW
jgi:hypothetical protein